VFKCLPGVLADCRSLVSLVGSVKSDAQETPLPVAPVAGEASPPRHASMRSGLPHTLRCRLMLGQAHSLPMPILRTTQTSPPASGSSSNCCRPQWHPRLEAEHRRQAHRRLTRATITSRPLAKRCLPSRLWEARYTRLKRATSASSLNPCSGARTKPNVSKLHRRPRVRLASLVALMLINCLPCCLLAEHARSLSTCTSPPSHLSSTFCMIRPFTGSLLVFWKILSRCPSRG
jgi:hypothetical protein